MNIGSTIGLLWVNFDLGSRLMHQLSLLLADLELPQTSSDHNALQLSSGLLAKAFEYNLVVQSRFLFLLA